ncbi:MAG: Glu-tRNA(Gln) amidotransferase subunit GatE [Calditrichaeota bacterium]|nr:Glu-tRNA(Gln) amidotransferase subunit GatE [Calditrichota bacterium]
MLKPMEKMTAADYAELGLKAGLEIHQQLKTKKKLFCRCPAGLYSQKYDAEILRHMRPTLSELGEYDGTALMEFKTKKEIIYQLNKETVCTYEMDDAPPFELNDEALEIALEIALLLKLNLVSELHIARKQYLDGSIPTGFQRTTILGVDGEIPYGERKIGIVQLGLEEDACREESDHGHVRVYRTDRLGMPLIEVVTYPDMRTPQEMADVAQLIRQLTRATGKVRRGIGATRQDVNVSIEGGTRIEIKGVPRIPIIPRLVHNEAGRQKALLEIRQKLRSRGVRPDDFQPKVFDVTDILRTTSYLPIKNAINKNTRIKCVRLPFFQGILSHSTQPGTNFVKEFSDRVRVIACLDTIPNLIHSDTVDETISSAAWEKIKRLTGFQSSDALIITWGDARDAETAVGEIEIRAREAIEGVPSETRQALADGTTGFERVLPGPNRMYPDTDLPPIALNEERIRRIQRNLPIPPWERRKKYRQLGLPEMTIGELILSGRGEWFDSILEITKIEPFFPARLLTETFKHWRRKGLAVEKLDREILLPVFESFGKKKIVREAVAIILEKFMENGKFKCFC